MTIKKHNNIAQYIAKQISKQSFSLIRADVLQANVDLTKKDLQHFFESWNDLKVDSYMNDGGRYRYRRYSVFRYEGSQKKLIERQGEPHYQYKEFNVLNGGIKRYFEPIKAEIQSSLVFVKIISLCINTFEEISMKTKDWHIEAHQFRIMTNAQDFGFPTPEGIHRDGVTYVFIMLISRKNIIGGESHLYDDQKQHFFSYFLENPLDCTFLDDEKLMHSVSAIQPSKDAQEGYRDTLVITFTKL